MKQKSEEKCLLQEEFQKVSVFFEWCVINWKLVKKLTARITTTVASIIHPSLIRIRHQHRGEGNQIRLLACGFLRGTTQCGTGFRWTWHRRWVSVFIITWDNYMHFRHINGCVPRVGCFKDPLVIIQHKCCFQINRSSDARFSQHWFRKFNLNLFIIFFSNSNFIKHNYCNT